MRTGTRFILVLLLLCSALLLAHTAAADIVYLKNGRSFDGVVAEEGGSQVRVQIEGGSLTLPRSSVARIEKADSSLAEYLRRRGELRREGAGARAWLDLARWADGVGLASAAREAALTAAAIDPRLEGLDRELRAQNYVYDPQLGRWLPFADEMRRKGMVLDESGDWMTRDEHAQRVRERTEAQMAQQMVQAQRDAAQADLLRAQAELYGRGPQGAAPYGPGAGYPYDLGYGAGFPWAGGLSFGFGGGFFSPGSGRGFRHELHRGAPFRSSVFSAGPQPFHQPGSLIRGQGAFVPVTPPAAGHPHPMKGRNP
jgi:hypothetical protein